MFLCYWEARTERVAGWVPDLASSVAPLRLQSTDPIHLARYEGVGFRNRIYMPALCGRGRFENVSSGSDAADVFGPRFLVVQIALFLTL